MLDLFICPVRRLAATDIRNLNESLMQHVEGERVCTVCGALRREHIHNTGLARGSPQGPQG